ncbi:MAG: YciI family protein [Candidatus Polarisedimenticolia bacterium]
MKRRHLTLLSVPLPFALLAVTAGTVHAELTGELYFVVLLKAGPSWTPDMTPEIEKLQQAHLDNIRKLHDAGKLVLAGPFLDDGDLRGMLVLTAATLEEARQVAGTDPMVKSGRLLADIHPWMGPREIKGGP